jgi:hypothetical protein
MSMDGYGPNGVPSDDTTMVPPWQRPPHQRRLGCGTKALIIMGVGAGILMLLCCGGIVAGVWYFASSISKDPEEIASVTREIAEIDIPEELAPGLSFNFKIPFVGTTLLAGAAYADEKDKSLLILAYGSLFDDQDSDKLADQIKNRLGEELQLPEEDVREWKHEQRQIQVRAQQASFSFARGTDESSGVERLVVGGMFEGKAGPTAFIMFADAQKYDEDAIVKIIESIR